MVVHRAVGLLLLLALSCLAIQSTAPIVISGAGPAALVFAHRFLRLNKNTSIAIFEKRERPVRYIDSTSLCVAGDYAFGFGVSQKAQAILRTIPGLLEAVEAISQPTSFAPGIEIRIVNRRELCAELIYELEKEFGNDGERLQLKFCQAVTDLDPKALRVTVTDCATNKTRQMNYSILIAADGANSIVRSKLIESGDLQCERYYSDVTWKALQFPEQPNLDPSAFQRYPKPFYKPHRFIKRDNGALIPRFQNRFVLLNFRALPSKEDKHQSNPFDATTPQQLREAISQALPNITNFPPNKVLQDFLNQPPGRESYMKLDRHVVQDANIILIGDAAVGMYSLFGQGCASAMTQANLLAETLANNATDLRTALTEYSSTSVKEGHAISDLNLLTHPLRIKGPLRFWALYQMMKVGTTLAQKPEVPYSAILKKRKRAIWFSKVFWRRVRVPAPTTSSPE
jgi:2-polyprenyl-6-methoxyphenol hydroxylase-like FAD-dependent oxidoreductase